jgi:hypothetical protein
MLKFDLRCSRLGLGLVAWGLLALPTWAASLDLQPPSEDLPIEETNPAIQRLSNMFSPEIRTVLGACEQSGGVDLAASGDSALLTCGDGSTLTEISTDAYIETMSDFWAASLLVGLHTAFRENPAISPLMLSSLSTDQGIGLLESILTYGIDRTQFLSDHPNNSPEPLIAAIVEKLLPVFQNPQQLDTLLGEAEQTDQVITTFCTAPGISLDAAQIQFPDLATLQLYAICIDASGLSEEMLRLVN